MDEFSSAPATQLTSAAPVAPSASLANPQAPPEVPKTPRRHEITRDQRLQIQTLAGVGLKYAEIAKELGITIPQVQYANTHCLTLQRRKRGQHGKLRQEQIDYLVEWVCSSKENRRIQYWKIPVILHWDVSENAIRYALKNQGFHRYIARRKPPISEKNRQLRLRWAQEHLNWTKDQWYSIFWTDETWITDRRHTRTWVTRRRGE